MQRFICTHCGHHFEHGPQETIVCPNCFWSTSVKKEDSETPSNVTVPNPGIPAVSSSRSSRAWLWAGGSLGVLLLGIGLFALRHLLKQEEILRTIESKNAQVIAKEAPELKLLPEEREILDRRIPFAPEAELTDSEKEVLAYQIPFRSRGIYGLPTPPWDEKQFDAFLKSEEAQYRVPLEWSYRRKLARLFKQHYLPAARAFEAKNYLKARDEWIRSLAFPIYQNDVEKHRGVVLTMLRPYVNDVLSKIGMMNAMLTEGDLFAIEEKIRSLYQALYDLLQKPSWEEAHAQLLELEKELTKVEKSGPVANPPPLPKEISWVDSDIREVLLAQGMPREAGIRDWEAFASDLEAKEKVIQTHLPATRELIRQQYEEALALIAQGRWKEARELLQKIDVPEPLREDAKAKIRILNKLIPPS